MLLIWVKVLSFFLLSSLEICLHLLSLHAPISDPVVPHWERQATGSSQTRRRAELPNHIPSLPPSLPPHHCLHRSPFFSATPPTSSAGNRLEAGWGDESARLCLELLVFYRSSSGHLSGMPTTAGCACFWLVSLLTSAQSDSTHGGTPEWFAFGSFLEEPVFFSHGKTHTQHWSIMEIWG